MNNSACYISYTSLITVFIIMVRSKSKAKQRCVMGVGMCLYPQLVQKNKQCKSAIILQCYHPHLSDFCFRPRLTQPYNHIISIPGVAKIYLVFFWKCLLYLLILLFLASCSIHLQFWVRKKIFLNHSDIYYLLILGYQHQLSRCYVFIYHLQQTN